MGFTNKANTKNIIVIQAVDNKVSSTLLSQSAQIITNRLKDFSSNKFTVSVIPEKDQIQVALIGDWDLKMGENLLLQKGSLAFYETYNRRHLSDILKANNQLFTLLNTANGNDSDAVIGCAPLGNTEKINDYIKTLPINPKYKLVWSQFSDNADKCLYALNVDNGKGALITGEDIEKVKFSQNLESKNNEIEITLKKSAVELWSNATKRNINKVIAIVLDDDVLSAPMVRSEITGGRCTITGNYTQIQAKYIAALSNNGALPVSFKVIK